MYKQKHKKNLWTIEGGPVTGKTCFPRVKSLSLSLSLPLLFRLNSHLCMEAGHVYLLALASKTHAKGSPRWGILRYSNGHQWPNVDGANLFLKVLLVFQANQLIQPIFSTKFSYYNILS